MKTIIRLGILSSTIGCSTQESLVRLNDCQIGKIAVFHNDRVHFNGKRVSIDLLRRHLKALRQNNGVVWYYRASIGNEPPRISGRVIQLIIEAKLDISFSTEPDFSTVVLPDGTIKPRDGL